MRALRLSIAAMVAMALIPLAAASATAAPPANDEAAGAVALSLGDRVVQNTTEATTNAGDDALNASCGAPATNATVWYKYTPAVDRPFVLDKSSSDFGGGFLVFEGTPTAGIPPDVRARVGRGGRAGGHDLQHHGDLHRRDRRQARPDAEEPTPAAPGARDDREARDWPTTVVAPPGSTATTSARTVTSLSCSAPSSQRAGRLKIPAEFDKRIRCNGVRHHWSARLVSRTGTYARGGPRPGSGLTRAGSSSAATTAPDGTSASSGPSGTVRHHCSRPPCGWSSRARSSSARAGRAASRQVGRRATRGAPH